MGLMGDVLMLTGAVFAVIGGIGLHRLPDFYSRMHASGITDTLGAGLILIGLMFHGGLTQATIKLAMILALLLITSPTAGHALARAALLHGLRPFLDPEVDDPLDPPPTPAED